MFDVLFTGSVKCCIRDTMEARVTMKGCEAVSRPLTVNQHERTSFVM